MPTGDDVGTKATIKAALVFAVGVGTAAAIKHDDQAEGNSALADMNAANAAALASAAVAGTAIDASMVAVLEQLDARYAPFDHTH
jgi:hypothetical protein